VVSFLSGNEVFFRAGAEPCARLKISVSTESRGSGFPVRAPGTILE
jgi:hypothetical protein